MRRQTKKVAADPVITGSVDNVFYLDFSSCSGGSNSPPPSDETAKVTQKSLIEQPITEKSVANNSPCSNSKDQYRDIAAFLIPVENAPEPLVRLQLRHNDPAQNIDLGPPQPFRAAEGTWNKWAGFFNLPMVILDQDGSVLWLRSKLGKLSIHQSIDRKRRNSTTARRPRFLKGRKLGLTVSMPNLKGTELIARR